MLGLSATNAGTPSVQLSLYQSELQLARRQAAQAADRVARLENETETARRAQGEANDHVRSVQRGAPHTGQAVTTPPKESVNTLNQSVGKVVDVTA